MKSHSCSAARFSIGQRALLVLGSGLQTPALNPCKILLDKQLYLLPPFKQISGIKKKGEIADSRVSGLERVEEGSGQWLGTEG